MRKLLRPRNIILAIIGILVIWGISSAVSAANAPKIVTTIQPRSEDLEVVISASGALRSKTTAALRFATTGRIASLPVKEGDTVKKGQVLGYINSLDVKEQENKAWSDYRYQLEVIREFEKNSENKPQDERYLIDKAQLTAQRDSAAAIVAQIRAGYGNRTLIAPIDGQITKIYKFQGDVATGDTILDIQNDNDIEFVAEVDEQDVGTIELGQSVLVNFDAFPRDEFPATINKIESIAQTGTSGNTFFPVKIDIQPTTQTLRIGMNGDALITTAQKSNVYTIPLEFLLEDDKSRTYVFVVENSTVQQRYIEIGLQNDTSVEVLSGLTPTDQIITSDTTNLKVNDKVEIKN